MSVQFSGADGQEQDCWVMAYMVRDLSKHREANGLFSHRQSLGVPSLGVNQLSVSGLTSIRRSLVIDIHLLITHECAHLSSLVRLWGFLFQE